MPCGYPGSGLPPGVKLETRDDVIAELMPILKVCVATQGHCDIWTQAATDGDVWVLDSAVAGVFADVLCLCYHRGPYEPCVEVRVGHAKLTPHPLPALG